MKVKDCSGFKLAPNTEDGTFEAIVSVFNNIDRAGDVVMPGAFAESLAEWKASGDPIPVLWSHRMDDPRYSIGAVIDAEELAGGDKRIPEWCDDHVKLHGGLWVRGQLHTGSDAGEVATAARKLLRNRLVKQFSYAYDIKDADWVTVDGREAYGLKRLHLHEVSPTQVACNDLTALLGAKAPSAAKGGYDLADIVRLATKFSEEITEAVAALDRPHSASDGGTSEGKPANDEEPARVKSEEPAGLDAASVRLLCEIRQPLDL